MKENEIKTFIDAMRNNPFIGITAIDKEGTCIFRTRITERFTGVRNSDIVGKHYSVSPHGKDLLEVLGKGVPQFFAHFKTASGYDALINRFPIKINNEIVGAISIVVVKYIEEIKTLISKYDYLKNKLKDYDQELRRLRMAKYTFENIVGRSDKVEANKKLAENYAQSNSPVLITGETGTGKELFAHAIHLASPRRDGPFIRVNCGAIPHDLIESELFGYEEGAFTGARKGTKIGKFELAHHGTIFLDEISLLDISMQPKLLTVLQNHEIERIGGNKIVGLDFRVISATNRSLEQMVEELTFRRDLYYRLNIFNLNLSPLRERKNDIEILTLHFLKSFSSEYGFQIDEIDPRVIDIFFNWNWPGNVRELRNVMERAVQVSNKKCITPQDLPDYLTAIWKYTARELPDKNRINILKSSRDDIEKKLVESALFSNNWNKYRTAKQLGISRSRLYSLIKRHDLQR
jgi:transcriptional regulator with PAS, ATPase and Fis domain